jgi:hypothetical protein
MANLRELLSKFRNLPAHLQRLSIWGFFAFCCLVAFVVIYVIPKFRANETYREMIQQAETVTHAADVFLTRAATPDSPAITDEYVLEPSLVFVNVKAIKAGYVGVLSSLGLGEWEFHIVPKMLNEGEVATPEVESDVLAYKIDDETGPLKVCAVGAKDVSTLTRALAASRSRGGAMLSDMTCRTLKLQRSAK